MILVLTIQNSCMVFLRRYGMVMLITFFSINQVLSQQYVPDNSLRTVLRGRVWNKLKIKTPKKQRFLTSLVFNTNQCFDLFEKAAKQRGWPSYTPATILSFREVVIQEAIIGRDYTEGEINAVYEETRLRLKKKNSDTSLNPKQLQEKYDPLILEALWIGTISELIKGRNDDAKNLALALLEESKNEPLVNEDEATSVASNDPPQEKNTVSDISNYDKTVEDIILRTVTNYGLNGVYIDNEVSILFKNGDLMTNPSEPLHQMNIAASKREHPKKWATWQKKGEVLFVTKSWKNKTYDWKKWFKLRPGRKGMKLIGTFNTMDAFGGDRVINASTASFDAQGRFAWKTIKGGNTPWKPVYSKSTSAGTYQIDGYTITLNYNNGQTESFFFGLYPKDNEHFVIGMGHFVPK